MTYELEARAIEIKIALLRRGISQTDIWRRLGVTSSAVAQVVNGRCRSLRIELAVAEATGIEITDLWPDRATQGKAA